MKLLEFQGKRLFAGYGIPVPASRLLKPGDSADGLGVPVALKAQVMTGGRGKAGGIRVIRELSELPAQLEELFALRIKGEKVAYLLAEECADIRRELYLSITFRGSKGEPVIIASGAGGVEIENIAKADPDKIVILPVDPTVGITKYQARYIAAKTQLDGFEELFGILQKLWSLFTEQDAQLVEINPLAVTPNGLLALDSKVLLDSKARFRHAQLFDELEREQGEVAEPQRDDTITFVPLEGKVALISDGAGTGMLTLDMVCDAGSSIASFCELGGVTNADVMYTAMKESLEHQGGARCLLIVLIGGFNRMDHMAEGIRRRLEEGSVSLPIVVRMCGTMEDEGKRILADIGVATVDDLAQAVATAARLAKEG